jgi:hypothetical protein
MKTKNLLLGLMVAAAVTILSIPSCSKEEGGSISPGDLSLAVNETYADALYEEVDNLVSAEMKVLEENAYSTDVKKSTTEDVCCVVTIDHPDSTRFPKVVTLDYGDGCTVVFNGDTITRQGQIIITVNDRWFVMGSTHSVTFNNFYINGAKIEGTKTITNLGLNERNNPETGIELEGGKITFSDTAFMTREASHVREFKRSNNPMNDTILVTGSANGLNVSGNTYTREIIDPLVLVHCEMSQRRWVISAGKVEVTNSKTGTTTIDYTGAGCDGTVIVNKNGYRHNYGFKFKNHKNAGKH